YGRIRRTRGCVNYSKDVPRGFRDHAAGGVADRAAERSLRIGEDGPSFEMPRSLSNSFIALAWRPLAKDDIWTNPCAVVASIRPCVFDRAEISDVNRVEDKVEPFSLHHTSQQRFRRGPVFRRVRSARPKHRAHCAGGFRFRQAFEREFTPLSFAGLRY